MLSLSSSQTRRNKPFSTAHVNYGYGKKETQIMNIACPNCGFERDQSLNGLVKQVVCPACGKKYKRTTIKEVDGKNKTFCMILFLMMILATGLVMGRDLNAGWFGPSNYEECILESMKGVTGDVAARQIAQACRKKFPNSPADDKKPKRRFFSWEKKLSEYNLSQISGNAGPGYGNYFSGNMYNGNTDITITQVTIRISTPMGARTYV